MKKRLLSLVMAAAMLFGSAAMLPDGVFSESTSITASAADTATSGKCGENVSWSLDSNGVLTISGTGEMRSYSVGYSPFSGNDSIKSVVIKNGVTSIGEWVFQPCKNLKSITIPDSVTSIGRYAFCGCKSLESITIPDSVTSIGSGAFSYCSSLESVNIPSSVTSIGVLVFYGCTSLKSISIPGSVTSIGDYAFGYYYDQNEETDKKVDGFKIYGYSGSAAQKYAVENGFEFNSLGNLTGKLGEKVTFEIDKNGVLTISGSGSMYDFEWDGSPMYDNSLIKKVVIKGGVTSKPYKHNHPGQCYEHWLGCILWLHKP